MCQGPRGRSPRRFPPDGQVAVFDGDYATTSVAMADYYPLQDCVDAAMAASFTTAGWCGGFRIS